MPEHGTKEMCDSLDARIASLEGQAPGGGPTIQYGITSLTAGQNKAVAFDQAFAQAPTVFVTSQTNNADTSCTYSAHTVTATGFMLRGAGNPAGSVAWLAIL